MRPRGSSSAALPRFASAAFARHVLLAVLALAPVAGCTRRGAADWLAGRLPGERARPAPALAWSSVDPGALAVNDDPAAHAVRFSIHLPAVTAAPANLAALEIGFRDRLEGAKVDATARGPRHTLRLLEHKRFAGDIIAIPLAPLPLDDIEVVVHNHLRPPPVIREVRIGRTPGAPGARP